MFVHRQEAHGNPVAAGTTQFHTELRALHGKEVMRHLDQNARSVSRIRVRTRGAAMRQVDQNLETLADDLLALLTPDAGNQAHATGIMLILWPVQALRFRNAVT